MDCPFDHSVVRQIQKARIRMASGHVNEDDFDQENIGRRAADLFADLTSSVPHSEDMVFTHGDYCLPNIILRRREPDNVMEITGFIDCGRAGLADRYQDLALGARSITGNYGEEWVPLFFDRYGLSRPDHDKLRFYRLLDEFF